jgi:probable rRNA maturation factor
MIEIELSDRQSTHGFDADRLVSAVRLVIADEGIARATVSIAVVDDDTIHDLNRRYLQHDYATDVLSFVFERSPDHLNGEVIVSADTAASAASGYGWSIEDELLLYVIHGALHLVGYDDGASESQSQMRHRERYYLGRFDLVPRYEEEAAGGVRAEGQTQGDARP